MTRPRPTRAELLAAQDRPVPDLVAPDLKVLFCGINPGLYTAAVGHHFAGPSNRFWKVIHLAGFVEQPITAFEEAVLLPRGYGITNVVPRATARADELAPAEFVAGGRRLAAQVRRWRPRILAVLGVGAYRTAFARPKAVVGPQDERLGATRLWVLPNPSGLNANYQLPDLVRLFTELRLAGDALTP
ncbi:MAG TPA: G/U mismatch-specific DNA glycosylase [Gemmatimonadales bacterium]|nr:G/U mismatch-specific DNA glycosylase [Gemmatimonadales bacterium]